MIAKHVQQVWP